MKFIEMSGAVLMELLRPEEANPQDLQRAGVVAGSIVRVNLQGDIEVRRREGWDVVGGLIGDYESRLRHKTGLDWA